MDGNTEFHHILDFPTCSSIYYALTVSPIVSTSFVEQFWTTAKSRTVNNISYIDVTVAGKPVTISEASIRSDLLFYDADGIDSLNNQDIFDNLQLMGNQLKDVPVPLDHFPVPTLTKKVLTFMVKKAYTSPSHPSEDQPQIQTDPSPRPSPSIAIPDSNLEGSGGNHGGQSSSDRSLSGNEDGLTLQSVYDLYISLCTHVSAQAKEIKALKAQVKKLKKGVKPLITHRKAWMKSFALKTRLARKTSLKKKGVQKEYVSKQGRKSFKTSKGEPSVHKDLAFDDLDDDTIDYMETEDAQDEGRTSFIVLEEKESAYKEVSTKAPVSIVKPNEGTDKRNEGTDKQDGAPTVTSTPTPTTPTPTVFGDDETIAQARLNADKILAEKVQEEEREMYTIEQRAKFLHDTIAAQRRFLAQQRSKAIRNKPPSRNQLRTK
ncbi:hypothetical protein Tco_0826740 [Tanacetum coccineum]